MEWLSISPLLTAFCKIIRSVTSSSRTYARDSGLASFRVEPPGFSFVEMNVSIIPAVISPTGFVPK